METTMFNKTTLSAAALVIAVVAIQPISAANAKTVFINPALVANVPAKATIFVPPKISCTSAKQAIKANGYKKVKKIECDGFVYTFKGKMNGKKYAIAINAVTKKIWTL
jgi:hypothetical protein